MTDWSASTRVLAALLGLTVTLAAVVVRRDAHLTCRDGLHRSGTRCCVVVDPNGACTSGVSPNRAHERIDLSPRETTLRGQSFERPHASTDSVHLAPFALMRTEVRCADALAVLGSDASLETRKLCRDDAERAAGGLRFSDAERICASMGGRVPSEAEWQRAAGAGGTRYPWGETGATCRAAVWGMTRGPCAHDADGPDTTNARPGGMSPDGFVDLAGNLAEWVRAAGAPVLKGGDYTSIDASELRVFSRRTATATEASDRNGARCAFDQASPVP